MGDAPPYRRQAPEAKGEVMPTLRPPTTIGLKHFPTRRGPRRRKVADMPPRSREVVSLMTFGTEDGAHPAMTLDQVAAHLGIKRDTAYRHFSHPRARAYYLELCRGLRDGEHVQNIRTAIDVRDSPVNRETAAGGKARIEAAKYLDGHHDQGHVVNVNVGLAVNTAPGYLIDTSRYDPAAVSRVLARAGSRTSIIEATPAAPQVKGPQLGRP